MDWEKLFGSTKLVKQDGEIGVNDALRGKYVAAYFSAHWCGPCRGFTPELVKSYKKMVADGKPLEIVFVSSDRSAGDFDKYYAEMPWLALDFDERETKNALSKKYKVQGIPTLVILNPNGEVITTDGRSAISNDPTGEKFPWTPPTFKEALGNTFEAKDGTIVTADALKNKYLVLQFSASWCPPCRAFSPVIIACYESLIAKGKGSEVEFIFISSDRDEPSYKEYRSHYPFLSVPFADRARKAALSELFQVEGIPTAILVSPEGKVVNTNARGAITSDPKGDAFPWLPKPVVDIDEGPEGINEYPGVLVLCDRAGAGADGKVKQLYDDYEAIAKQHIAKVGDDEDKKVLFFVAKRPGELCDRIRALIKLPAPTDGVIQLVLLNIPEGAFYVHDGAGEVNGAAVRQFLSNFEAGALKNKQSFK